MDLTSRVLARPGAPVIRQCPPAKSAINNSSMTSFWPTMTLASSVWICARPVVICSTTCFSAAIESDICSIFPFNNFPSGRIPPANLHHRTFRASLMRHRIENDVDGERICDLLREVFEIIMIVALPFPAVAVVGVVRGEHHDPPLVIINGLVMNGAHVAVVVGFPGDAPVRLAGCAQFDVWNL